MADANIPRSAKVSLASAAGAATGSEIPRKLIASGPPSWELLALLRFFLAWIVLCGHLSWFSEYPTRWLAFFGAFGGKAAVIGFLAVSGFSIASSIEHQKTGFYRRRFLRIYPLYFFAVLFAIALEHMAGGRADIPNHGLKSFGPIAAVGNLFLVQTFLVKPIAFNGPVWSLAVEVFFYAWAPLIIRLRHRYLVGLIVLSAISWLCPTRPELGLVYQIFRLNAFRYLWCWILGFLLWQDSRGRVWLLALACSLLLIFGDVTREPLAPVTYLVSLAAIFGSRRIRISGRAGALANYLGDLSYPLYLFHFPTFILGYVVVGTRSAAALTLLALVISVAAYHLIDRLLKRKVLTPRILPRSGPPSTRSISRPAS